jgi:hypothetical protein
MKAVSNGSSSFVFPRSSADEEEEMDVVLCAFIGCLLPTDTLVLEYRPGDSGLI